MESGCQSWNVVWNDGSEEGMGSTIGPEQQSERAFLRHNVRDTKKLRVSTNTRDRTINVGDIDKALDEPHNQLHDLDNNNSVPTRTASPTTDYGFVASISWFVVVLIVYILYRVRLHSCACGGDRRPDRRQKIAM